jgi:anti-sigma regulatory factor (Ser/Thr protein kinase)
MSGSIGAASNYPPAHDHAGHSAHPRFGHWHLASRLELGPLPSAVPCARLHAKHIFREWGLAHVADDAELIVSELMTNALNAAKPPPERQPITLQLLASREYLLIQVWDALTAAPAPRPHAIDSETGRGLEIVTLLCDQWGYYHPAQGGKVTWAALVTGAAPGTAQGTGP